MVSRIETKVGIRVESVGVPLSVIAAQIVVVLVAGLICAILIKNLGPKPFEHPVLPVGVLGTGLIVFFVLLSWIVEVAWPLPQVVHGYIEAPDNFLLLDARIAVLDVMEQELLTVEGGRVDTSNGYFYLAYEKSFGVSPRWLVVDLKKCETTRKRLSLGALRNEQEIRVRVQCTPATQTNF